jgi:Skp family chaperone for outer membrane proteins
LSGWTVYQKKLRNVNFAGAISCNFLWKANLILKMIAASSSTNALLHSIHGAQEGLKIQETLRSNCRIEEVYGSEFEFAYSEKAKDRESLLNLSAILNKEILSDAASYRLDKLPNIELNKTRTKLREKQSLFQLRLETEKQSIKSDLLILHTYMKQTQKEEEWRNKLTQRAQLIQAQPKSEIPKEISKPPSSNDSTPSVETPPESISTPPTISVSPNLSLPISASASPQARRRGSATEAKEHFNNTQMIEKMKEQWKKVINSNAILA